MDKSRRVKYLDHELPSDPTARRKALQRIYEKTLAAYAKLFSYIGMSGIENPWNSKV